MYTHHEVFLESLSRNKYTMVKVPLAECSILGLGPPQRMGVGSGPWKQLAHLEWSSFVKYVFGTNFLIWSFISVKSHMAPLLPAERPN